MSRNFDLFQQIDRERQQPSPCQEVTLLAPVARQSQIRLPGEVRTEITRLVQRVFLLSNGFAPRVILFTAIEATSKSSRVCAYSADLLAAHITGSVCLVDANLTSPSLHEAFGRGNTSGLTDLVNDSQAVRDIAIPVSESNLWLLSSGPPVAGVEEMIGSETMRFRMAELRSEFDYVLINAPPAGAYSQVASLAALTDGVILVLQAHSTRRDVARQVKEELESAGARVLGAVLNDRSFPIPQIIYSRL
jgi:Mrp family chromosome partitioning ATPase